MITAYLRHFIRFLWRLRWRYFPLKNPYVNKEHNKLYAYRCYDGKVQAISPVQGGGAKGLSENLIQEPSFISLEGNTFDLRQDGVYRFYKLGEILEQRLVCSGGVTSFFKMAGYIWCYGNADVGQTEISLYKKARNRTVSCTCGELSKFALFVLSELGHKARLVASVSQDGWGGQDDGHTLLEVYLGMEWIAYDPSFNMLYKKGNDFLSLYDLISLGVADVTLYELPGHAGCKDFITKDYNYGFWVEARLLSKEFLREWYAHVIDVPLISERKKFYFPIGKVTEENMARFQWQYFPMKDDDFINLFYSAEGADYAA
ncbi:transglutaminase domain-containing protein [Micavibrio aeruginosavorus]|uniref:transglutaminase domain-containing protein n=1 Tax=Micavibrio aeruginosavorus TaxID=349221 RepID=UPI003F4A90D4